MNRRQKILTFTVVPVFLIADWFLGPHHFDVLYYNGGALLVGLAFCAAYWSLRTK